MATIDIRRPHSFDKETAKSKAESLAKSMQEKLGLQWSWQGDAIAFNAPSGMAKGTTGKVAVSEREVHVAVDLPFLLRAAKGKVESKITEKLDEILA
ncbi:MAG: polyhydroxyalkanoic acid system family protein [Myxococcales bacterium]|nr:polyhydroxyalkanoic acid system family protein [Myxococcales bacterium]MCB9702920.1 polyhydroxyalkanoic acid system family protein [Myxococcales bacterium]